MEEQDPGNDASPVEMSSNSTLPPPLKTSITLPSLFEAIPEYRSHTPSRKSESKPRGLTSLISPTALPPHPFGSPVSPGRTIPNAEVNLTTLPSAKRRRLSIRTSIGVPYPQTESQRDELRERRHVPLTPHSRAASVSGPFQMSERSLSASVLPSFPQLHHSSMPSQRHFSMVSPRASTFDVPMTPASSDRQTFGNSYHPDHPPVFTSPFEKDRQYQSTSLNEVIHSTHQNHNILQHKLSPTSPNPSLPYPGQMYPGARITGSSQDRSPFSTGQLPQMDHSDPYDQLRGGKRRRGNLPKQVTDLLRNWLHAHLHHPYPTEDQKLELVNQTGLTMNQVCPRIRILLG
ncbi:hypothetical protein ABW20_dc0103793 [Dactylellina cionopaga]|nr:hypothetical protein ABW20_dc0103793 [Dactylellina cionopaga]